MGRKYFGVEKNRQMYRQSMMLLTGNGVGLGAKSSDSTELY